MKFALVTFGNEESYGLLYVGGELLEHQQDIKFFDGESDTVVEDVYKWNPDYLMLSPMTTFLSRALSLSTKLKKLNANIVSVFGGHHATSAPEILYLEGVDTVVRGPVRGSINQILNGIVGLITTSPTIPSDLAFPSRKQYYADIPRMAQRYRKVMLSMLGCPWNCSYCSSSSGHNKELFGNDCFHKYYLGRRPLSAIIKEAREIIEYPTKEIEWVDDDVLASSDETWMFEFLSTWKREINLPMYVSATSVSILKASDKLLKKMKDSVNVVGMGVQAGRSTSLKIFNRQWDNENRMKLAYDRLTKLGYKVNLQCIVGLPVTDPVEDAIDTIKCLQRIGAGSTCSCYPLMVYPSTALEKYCLDNKIQLNTNCNGDTNSGVSDILFDFDVIKKIKNICKLATLFVKYNISEEWIRALIQVDFDDSTSKLLSTVRYHDCVVDRLGDAGEVIFKNIMETTNLRY